MLTVVTLVAAVATAALPGALASGAGTWDGSRAELFLVNITTPSLTAGGPAGALTATLVNRGPSNATNARFTYTVPNGLTFNSATVAGGSCTFGSPTVTCTVPNLANGASAAVSISLSAPAGTTPATVNGTLSPVAADQFTPAGGDLLLRERNPDWIGNNDGDTVSGVWTPSEPYGSTPPCVSLTDVRGVFVNCANQVTSNDVITSSVNRTCNPTSNSITCLRTWEMIGTYYATSSGPIRLCMQGLDDGAYVNWSAGYDPATTGVPAGGYSSVAQFQTFTSSWTSNTWNVTSGQAYRFSIRLANRDQGFDRGRGLGGFEGFGLSTVNGSSATCSFTNFAPPRTTGITVLAPSATISLTKALGNARVSNNDQFTVQIKDSGGTVVNSTAASTTTGSGSTVTPGTGVTGITAVTPGSTYTLTEAAAGSTNFRSYSESISCTNSTGGSATVLPNGPVNLASPPTIRPATGDVISCVLNNTAAPPTVQILKTASGGNATFSYTVTGGPTPANATVTTVGGNGSLTLGNTVAGQSVTVTENSLAGWTISSSACFNRRIGQFVGQPFNLNNGDQIICSYANRAVPPGPQPCVTNPIRNPNFNSGATGWTTTGGWELVSPTARNWNDAATFAGDVLSQTVSGVAPASTLLVDVNSGDGFGGNGGNQAALQIWYGGVLYATIDSSPVSEGFGGNVTAAAANGATINATSFPMGATRTIALQLPTAIPRSGALEFKMAITENADVAGKGDDFYLNQPVLQTTGLCLQKRSSNGFATFTFTSTNIDTDPTTPATDPGFSVSTTAGNNPATVNPDFGTGTRAMVVTPGAAVTLTETGPLGTWSPTAVTCTNAATGANVPGITLSGATITVPGGAIPARTILNCLIDNAPLSYRVSKVASPASTSPGGTVTYTATVTNTGTGSYPNASFTDDLTGVLDDATFGAASATSGTVGFTSPILTWTGTLAAGASATVTYTVVVRNPDPGDHRLVNQVRTVTSGGNCAAGSPDPACTTTTPVADLRIAKSVDRATAKPGDVVTYTATATNIGQATLTGVSFTDNLTDVLDDATFGTAGATTGTASFSTPLLTWTGTLAVGAVATVTYTVQVNNPDLGNHQLANLVVSTAPGSNCLSGSTDPACRAVTAVAGLRIEKTADKTSLNIGESVQFTIVVTNTGTTTQSGTLFADDLTDVADDAVIGTPTTTSGSLAFSSPQLLLSGTLLPGASATVRYTATVRSPDPGNHKLTNAVTSTVPGTNCPTGVPVAPCTVTVPVASLTIAKSADRTSTAVGDTVTYTVRLTNTGQTRLVGASFTDDLTGVLDDGDLANPAASTGAVNFASPLLTWTGDLDPGVVATVTYQIVLHKPGTGNHRLVNTVSSATPSNNCPSAACASDIPVAELHVTKTADPTVASPGAIVTYHIVVANIGQVVYTNLVGIDDISGELDDATFLNAVASGGSIVFQSPLLIWTGGAPLPVGGIGTATYTVRVNNPDTGDHHLINSLSSDAPGSNCPGAPECVTDTPVANLTVTKSVNVPQTAPGEQVVYTVAVQNAGQTSLTGLSVVDDVSGVLDDATFVSSSATNGSVTFTSPLLSWASGDPLAPGATATITYVFQVNKPDTGDHHLINSLTSTSLGASCPGRPQCTTDTPVSELTVVKQVDQATVQPGQTARYTVTATNTGQVALTAAVLTDDLSGILDDATVSAITASVGSAQLVGTDLVWTGDLAPGAAVTVSYQATVHNPVTGGDRVLTNAVTSPVPGSSCPLAGTGTSCATSTPVAALEISKQVDRPTANPGDTVTYTVQVTNLGSTPIPGATFTDNLTDVLDDASFVDVVASAGAAGFSTPLVTWTGDLAVDAVVTVVYRVTVLPSGSGSGALINTVTSLSAGSNCATGSTDPRCTRTTLVNGFTIVKASDHSTAVLGDTVTYTVKVTNTGQTALTGATFTDSIADVLDDATLVSGPAVSAGPGAATLTGTDVVWTGDLLVGQQATVTYAVLVNRPDNGNHLLVDQVTSTTPGADCTATGTNPACTVRTPVADLRIVKTVNVPQAAPGDTVVYTVTVTNAGQVDQPAATFTDTLTDVLDDATYVSASATIGSVTLNGSLLTWTGSLAIGAGATVTYTVKVRNPDPGNALLHNSVVSTNTGASCGTTTPCSTDTPVSRLVIVKTSSSGSARPGEVISYQVTVTNTGQVDFPAATFTDNLTGVLDDAALTAGPTATVGTATFTTPNVVWTGALAPGAVATVSYQVTINNPDTGDKVLTNAITSTTAGNNCPCGTTTPVGTLTITKTASVPAVSAGGTVDYTIVAVNSGQVPLTAATFTDDLTGILDDATVGSVTATAGSVGLTGATLTWTGDLPVGVFVAVSYRATVLQPDPGDHRLANQVSSTTPGNNCAEGDPRCATLTPVAELQITTVVDAVTAEPGQTVNYTITVTNLGQTEHTAATFTDDIADTLDDADLGPLNATIGTVTQQDDTLVWAGDLTVGAVATITYPATVRDPDTGNHRLVNVLTSTTPGSNCPTAAACGTSTLVGDAQIAKSVDRTTAAPGDTVTYTVTIVNSGQTPLTDISFTDNLTGVIDDATFVSASADLGSAAFASPTLTWTGTVPVGQTATVVYRLTVNTPATGDHVMTNLVLATAPGSNCTAQRSDPVICSTTTTVAGLVITKTASPASTVPGGTVTYTVTVTNSGQTPQSGDLFTDDLTGVLDDADFGTAAATVGTPAFRTPLLTLNATLAPGATSVVTYTVIVRDPDTGDHRLVNLAASTAPGAQCSCTTTTLVGELAIVKTVNITSALPGQAVTYQITVSNTGQTAVTGVSVTDDLTGVLDDATLTGSPTATRGSASFATPLLHWTGDLGPAENAVITYTVTVLQPDTGDHRLDNSVSSPTPGSPCPVATPCTTSTPVGELVITKTLDRASAAPGDLVTYQVAIANVGTTAVPDATFTDNLTGVLDDAVFGTATATSGTPTFTSPLLTWVGDLAAGDTATVTYTVTVADPVTGDHRLTNSVTSTTAGTNCPTTTPCTTDTPVGAMSIVKVASVTSTVPGGTVGYTVTVTNTGQTTLIGATFNDYLGDVLDDADLTNSSATIGSATFTAPNLAWIGDLNPGQASVISYTFTVKSPDPGNHLLVNQVTSTVRGADCQTSAPCVTQTPVASMTISKSVAAGPVTAGGVVTYTVAVANAGQTTLTNATLVDDLTGVLDDATFTSSSATVGTTSFTTPNLTWTGTLAPAESATVTYSVTVHTPPTGDDVLVNAITSTTPGAQCLVCTTSTPITELAITKTVSDVTAVPGQTVTYTLTVHNTGATPIVGAQVSDDLSGVLDDAVFNTVSATIGAAAMNAAVLLWTGDLGPGAQSVITYSVTVNSPVTGDHRLTNLVTSPTTGATCTAAAPCSTDTPVAGVTINKSVSSGSAVPGGTIQYQVSVVNNGQVAQPAATFTDSLAGILDDAVVSGIAATIGTAQLVGTDLVWTGALAIGATAVVTYTATINDPDTGDHTLGNAIVSSVPGSNCPGAPNCATDTRIGEVSIVKTVDRIAANAGDLVTYTVTVTNNGATALPAATFNDDLTGVLDDAAFVDATATTGQATFTTPNLTWTGALNPTDVVTVTYVVHVNKPDTGDLHLVNSVTSTVAGASCTPAEPCSTDTPVAQLSLTKSVDRTTAAAGDTVGYTLTVTNNGAVVQPNVMVSDDLTGVLDDADFVAVIATSGSASFTSPLVQWVGSLAVGATVTVTYAVQVHEIGQGNHHLTNAVSSPTVGASCLVCATDTPVSELRITKTATPAATVPGGTVAYSVTVLNAGAADATGVSFTDDLTGVLDDATVDPAGVQATIGVPVLTGATLTWTGDLVVGQSALISYAALVNNPDTGDHNLVNAVTPTSTGGACATCTTQTPVGALTITKTVNVTSTVPGGTVEYLVTVRNAGQTTVTGATFTDDLSLVLDQASIGTITASTGQASLTGTDLTWVGDLLPGGVATVGYPVTVDDPVTGSHHLRNAVTSATPGVDCVVCATDTPISQLAIVKSASPASTFPGGTVTYTVKVTNEGATTDAATFTDDLTGVLDDATFGSATADIGTATFTTPNLTWTGTLPPAGVATVTYTVTVDNPVPGDHNLHNAVATTTPGASCATCTTDTPIGALSITKTVDRTSAAPDQVITYTTTVSNAGQAPVDGAFTDNLTGVLDDAAFGAASATLGAPVFTSPLLTWTGTVPGGQSAVVTYTVRVNRPDTGDHLLTNAVTTTTPGAACPACSTTTPVGELRIAKSASPPSTAPGGTVDYQVVVTNTGQTTVLAATFTDDLSGVLDGADLISQSATVGTVDVAGTLLSWTGDLAPAVSATVSYRVRVHNPYTAGTFHLVNVVTSSNPESICTACTTDTPIGALTITKAADRTVVPAGGAVTYTVTVANTGAATVAGASFTDDLTGVLDDATFRSASATVGTASFSTPLLTWTGDLAAGQSAQVTYTVDVRLPDPGDGRLTNVVTPGSPALACLVCTTDTAVQQVTLTKSASPASTVPGGTVTYTVTVANTGTAPVAGATFVDDLTGVLDDASTGAATADIGTAQFVGSTLTWTGDLAVGATATVTYTVVVDDPVTGDHHLVNAVTSTTAGASCTTCATDTGIGAVTVTKTVAETSTVPGGTVHYTVTVTNTGAAQVAGAQFVDDLTGVLDDAQFGAVTADIGAATFVTPRLQWSGTLDPGQTATIAYTVVVNNPDTGDHLLGNAVSSTTPGLTCQVCSTSTPVGQVTVTKSVGSPTAVPGGTVTYTVAVANSGQAALTGVTFTDDLTGVLDDATFGSATATLGSATFTTPNLVWVGDLPVGATATVTYTVIVNNPDTGDHRLTNAVSSSTPGLVCAVCATDTAVSAFTVTKTVSEAVVPAGGTVHYTVRIANTGQSPVTGVTVTDDLTGVLDDAAFGTADATAGVVSFTTPTLTWQGDLPVAGTVTVTYDLVVHAPDPGDHHLVNNAATGTPGGSCLTCATDTPVAEALVTKTVTPAELAAGQTATYTVTVVNSGATALTGVSLTDDLTGALDDADFGTATADLGSATFTTPTLLWTGDLPVASTATITYTMVVHDPDTGDRHLRNSVVPNSAGLICAVCATDTPVAGLEIAKSVDRTSTFPGDTVTYQVVVTNTGPATVPAASFIDDLTNVVNQATFLSSSADVGTVTFSTPLLTWTGSLAPGAQATVRYAVQVAAGTEGGHLRNAVTSTVPGASCPGATSCTTDTPIAGLNVTKSVDRTVTAPGETVTYTVTVTNTGASVQSGTLFTDDLTGVLTGANFVAGSSTTGTVTFSAPLLTLTGTLAPTEVATVSYSVQVHAAGTVGSDHLVNSVTSTVPGAQCPVCSTDTPVAVLTLRKSASPTVVAPGDLVTYTVVVTNDGATAYTPASFVDDLSQVLVSADFVSASASVGTVQFSAPLLSWSGPLAPGESATVTYSLRVHASAAPGTQLLNGVQSDLPGSSCPGQPPAAAAGSAVRATMPAVPTPGTPKAAPADCGTTVTVNPATASPTSTTPSTGPPTTAPPTTAPATTPPATTVPPTTGPTTMLPATPVSMPPVVASVPAPAGTGAGPGRFPLTGASVLRLVVIGLVLVAGSLVLLVARRRRTR
jgi:uncharacterized repeat protein (TIGR01451 family)